MVTFTHLPFTPGERAPGTHWIGGLVDSRAGLDDWRRENSRPYRDSNSDLSVVQPVASRYTDYAIPAPNYASSYNNIARYWGACDYRRVVDWITGFIDTTCTHH
jgi:hypothetical protein